MHDLYYFDVDQMNCTAGISLTSLTVTYLTLKSRSQIDQYHGPSNSSMTRKLYHFEIDCMICVDGMLLRSLPVTYLTLKGRLKIVQGQ